MESQPGLRPEASVFTQAPEDDLRLDVRHGRDVARLLLDERDAVGRKKFEEVVHGVSPRLFIALSERQ